MRYAAYFLLAGALFAQERNAVSSSGFGRILFPGGTPPSGASPFGRVLYPGTGAPAMVRNTAVNRPPQAPHPGHSQPVAIPYPVYFGGNFVQYDPPQAPSANNYQRDPNVPEAPVVIVNQYFRPDTPPVPVAASVVAAPAPVALVDSPDTGPVFLIAMKDHTVYAASAYWVEDGVLNYVTTDGDQNSASMELVDRNLSRRLNRDRRVAFGLPEN
jgi:hypothetical protein